MRGGLARYGRGLTRDTYLLSFTSMFADISTEMLYPILPSFVTQVLGATAGTLAGIEGIATATQYLVQGPSGWLSDRLRKPGYLAAGGFLVAALAKPLIGAAAGWPEALTGRFVDRFGTGIRSAPRDAMIAASASEGARGRAYGMESLGDNLGAFIGPLVCAFLLFGVQLHIRSIFYVAVVPGLVSVALVLMVRGRAPQAATTASATDHRRLPAAYWRYLVAVALFGLGNATSALVILRAQGLGLSLEETLLAYAGLNLTASLASLPAGYVADQIGRKSTLIAAFAVFVLVYLGFAIGENVLVAGLLLVVFGVFQGTYRTVGKALAADLSTAGARATGLGLYSMTIGLTGLVASVVGGQLWDRFSPSATFWYGGGCALAGILALLILVADRRKL